MTHATQSSGTLAGLQAMLRTAIMVGVLTLLSGCLVSYKPLFESSVYPFPSGTQLLVKSSVLPKGSQEVFELTAENDGYTAKSKERSLRFKLHPLDDSTWLMMIEFSEVEKPSIYQYLLLKSQGTSAAIGHVSKKDFLAWAKANNIVTGWVEEEDSIDAGSIELVVRALGDLVDWSSTSQSLALEVFTPERRRVEQLIADNKKFQEEVFAEIEANITAARNETVHHEQVLRDLCGGRICHPLEGGRTLYRTETYSPPVWYYQDGRLAPEAEWPE
ncbi:hypothetical protein [Pseudomonas sp. Pse1]|jgi:hypothetical protein|uniref:hypothetical protein n=1 Tax=Pseudomonas sp. Pse1 TaxID=2926020 RepID=UPI002118C8BB|nr:hypothetical protein [Pseudomonas sp. Pse1]